MPSLAQVARQTRRGLFGLRGQDARQWRETIDRFQASRSALTHALALVDDAAAGIADPHALDALYQRRNMIERQASIMDATANAITSASKVMNLSGLGHVGLFGCFNATQLGYPLACATLDQMSATAERLAGLGLFQATETFGGALWEFLHPGTVQEEFVATGNVAPSQVEIMSGAATRMREEAAEGAVNLLGDVKTYAILGGIVIAIGFFMSKR